MGIFDFLKKKKSLGRQKRPTGPRRAKGAKGSKPKPKPAKPAEKVKPIQAGPPKSKRLGGKTGDVYKILKEPHISEKATQLSDKNHYTFKVYPKANKNEVAKAVANLYGVKIKSVNMINIKPKTRVLRGQEGKKTGYKKAIVTLEKGHKIEIMPH